MQVEWEITLACNYMCDYCGLLDSSICDTVDTGKLHTFINMLNLKYSDVELFLFGGEPFLHKSIGYIISTLNSLNQPFVIQTNLSDHSVKVITELNDVFNINISVHIDRTSIMDICNNIKRVVDSGVGINNIDIMFTGMKALEYYTEIVKIYEGVRLCPVTDIGCTGFSEALTLYNSLKYNPVYPLIYNFDDVIIEHDGKCVDRSKLWEMQNNGDVTVMGNPCMYRGEYILFDPALNSYNCCYRINNNGICPNNKCFFM